MLSQRIKSFVAAVLIGLVASPLHAALGAGATYYVNFDGSNGDGSQGNPFNTFTDAGTAVGGGNVLMVVDGNYSVGVTSIPSGTVAMPTMVKASSFTAARFTQQWFFDAGQLKNVDIHNVFLDYADEKIFTGYNIRLYDMLIKGGQPDGNNVKLAIGRGDYDYTYNVSLNNVTIYGTGGRYDVLVYNSRGVVFNECLARKDGGWDDEGTSNPEANYTVYDSSDVVFVNTGVIDSTGSYSTMVGGFYEVDNNTTDIQLARTHHLQTYCQVVGEYCYRVDANATNSSATWRNTLAWNSQLGGYGFGSGNNFTGQIHNFTIGASSPTSGEAIGAFGNESLNIKNGIMTGNSSDDFNGVSGTYFDTFNNGGTATGTGQITVNPYTNGLTWLNRVEAGSTLATAGENGTYLGAEIEKRFLSGQYYRGVSGTGWDVLTNENVWPLRNEATIKTHFCAGGVTKGVCAAGRANTTLTQYIIGRYANYTSPYASETGTTLSASFTGSTPSSFTVTWTSAAAAAYTTAMSSVSTFVPTLSSGSILPNTSTYIGLTEGVTYYFKVKLSTESDTFYTTAISTCWVPLGGGGGGGGGGSGNVSPNTVQRGRKSIRGNFKQRTKLENPWIRRYAFYVEQNRRRQPS